MATRKERVILDLDPAPYVRGLATAKAATAGFVAGLDTSNNRAALLTQSLLAIGPALVPITAAAVPVLSGLTTQLGFAAAGAGVTALAFNGVGDALEALNDYQLEPTEQNLEKLQETMRGLGPEARDFVLFLDEITPRLQELREQGQGDLLPGVQDGIDAMLDRLPEVRNIISEIATVSGRLASETGTALASEDWDEFFTFLEREAQPTLLTFGRTVGNVFEGLANTWMALDPLSDGFARGLLDWSRDFADATENLDDSERFQGFLEYVQRNGPRAAEALGAIGGAASALVQAAAPVGAATLPVIEALADALALVMRSPAGPILIAAAAGISAVSRAIALYNAANGSAFLSLLRGTKDDAAGAARGLSGFGKAVAGFAALNVAFVALDQLNQRLDETLPGLEELKARLIALADLTPGSSGSLGSEFDTLAESIARVADGRWDDGLQSVFDAVLPGDNRAASLREATAEIDALDAALASLVASGDADVAEQALANLADQYGLTRGQVDRLLPLLDGYQEALAGQKNTSDLAADGTDNLRRAHLRAAAAAQRQRAALKAARDEAAGTAREFFNLGNAVEDGKQSLGDFLRNLEKQADALRNFRVNAQRAAERGLNQGLIRELQRLGPEGARQMAHLANATEGEIDRANAAWTSGQRQVRLYKNEVGGVPERKSTHITVTGIKESIDDVHSLYNAVAALRSKTISVTTVFTESGRRFKEFGPGAADGAMVPKTGLPYADRHPYLLADGEHIVSNRFGQADKNRPELEAANAGAKLAVVGYADGGRIYGAGGSSSMQVDFGRATVDLRYPDGRVQSVELMARVADRRIDAARRHDRIMEGR